MIHIQMYGVSRSDAAQLNVTIHEKLKGAPYRDIRVTLGNEQSFAIGGGKGPFLQVIATRDEKANACTDIAERLAELKIDILPIAVGHFIPAKK